MNHPLEKELADQVMKEYQESRKYEKAKISAHKLDYDLFVIDPNNKDTTPEQLRDCIYDALQILDERTRID